MNLYYIDVLFLIEWMNIVNFVNKKKVLRKENNAQKRSCLGNKKHKEFKLKSLWVAQKAQGYAQDAQQRGR
jgi:hypothetical protein